jgi:cytochrome c oxidase assembly factor CtaG
MKRAAQFAGAAAASVAATGAKTDEFGVFMLVAGAFVALFVVLGMPLGLLVHAWRRDWIDAEARALEQRATACVLLGAGGLVAAVVAAAALAPRAPALAVLVMAAA